MGIGALGTTERIADILSENAGSEDSFYVYNVDTIRESYALWQSELPGVHPYYAVKCNPNPVILETLAGLGAHFDCASPAEIDAVLALDGVAPCDILYANPCKRILDMEYAWHRGVDTVTFDHVGELRKIMEHFPDTKFLLRIYANDPKAQCQLSNKFGAHPNEWKAILACAVELGANIVGASFHVGSGASSGDAFALAIAQCRRFCDLAAEYGFVLTVMDIGGGFSQRSFQKHAAAIRDAIAKEFPWEMGMQWIAEPGRFFAETAADLYTKVIGVREHVDGSRSYTLSDGLYGSFNCILYDHAVCPKPEVVSCGQLPITKLRKSTLYGPTCDGADTILKDICLPVLGVGDCLRFRNMGAYTISGATKAFNGIPFSEVKYYAI